MWPSLIAKAKQGGLDVIQTYVFWNLHEPHPGQYDFAGRNDIVSFIKEVQRQGLYISLRIGLFIEAKWSYGLIENEYQMIEGAFHKDGTRYVNWTAQMAVSQNTGEPWMMCKQDAAPGPVINTCNGKRCGETWKGPNSLNKPSLWTENWTSLQPKYGHLKHMHAALKLCSIALLYGELTTEHLGTNQDAYVYNGSSGKCAAFLVNNSSQESVQDAFRNSSYNLPSKSISILPDCKNVVFNIAMVSTQVNTRPMQPIIRFDSPQQWEAFSEAVSQFEQTSLRSNTLLEQMNTTKDKSDYLWYTMSILQNFSEAQHMLKVNSRGHVLRAYVNGALVGTNEFVFICSAHGARKVPNFTFEDAISFSTGTNNISLLSIMVGLPVGAFMERKSSGLREVLIQELNFTRYSWGYQAGLVGEKLSVYTDEGSSNVSWNQYENPSTLTWYKTTFDTPEGDKPIALNLGCMGKGEAWINGQSIGRYWVSFKTPSGSPSQTWINSWGVHDRFNWRPWPRVHLRCPRKRIISKIVFASHGNPSGDCESYSIGNCHSSNSQQIVEKVCLGKRQCSISHTTENFGGDSCPGTPKALLVDAHKSTQTIASSLLELGGVQISKQDVVKDEPTNNVPDLVFTKLGLQLHRRDNHPLGILKNAIYEYFDSNYNNQIHKFDDLCPIVTTKKIPFAIIGNFDDVLVPADHVSRSYNDTYYIDAETVLRCHTSAHQADLLRKGYTDFLVTGDVYRRDSIDSTHYPVFHQWYGVINKG
ncbi:hypothetical protein L1987_44471 [Smallanthus sonchifolius]|uniref:Uncharacterized protein n=1 Tax=Smallanthus sonchifolius TaxID=185202 RepID=A0ACB9GQB4_9ASTR|nr:hypothetical protein L1987_44471 [Smallanthus sonchifolius]